MRIGKKIILNAASITLISVAVFSRPENAHQSLTIRPALITSEPLVELMQRGRYMR